MVDKIAFQLKADYYKHDTHPHLLFLWPQPWSGDLHIRS